MDVREKLVKIICDVMETDGCICHCNHSPCFEVERVVNALIDSGVTVQEWISVNENPKWKGCYIVVVNHWVDGKPVAREAYWNGCDWLSCDKKLKLTPRVTHWMQLPQPPKGE